MPKTKEKTVKKAIKKKKVEDPVVGKDVEKPRPEEFTDNKQVAEKVKDKPQETEEVIDTLVEKSPEQIENPQVIKDVATPQSTYFVPLEPVRVETKRSFMWWGIFMAAALFGFGASLFFYYKMFQKNPKETDTVNQVLIPTQVIPTQVDLSSFSIQILNGSGIKGEAAKVKSLLEESGFKVSEVGNAETSEYKETIIQKKDNVNDVFLDELTGELGKNYVVQVSSKSAEKEDSDVVVIVGSEKREKL